MLAQEQCKEVLCEPAYLLISKRFHESFNRISVSALRRLLVAVAVTIAHCRHSFLAIDDAQRTNFEGPCAGVNRLHILVP